MPTLPTSGTDVVFMSGIPFTSDYKHTRWFGSKAEQTVYFGNQTVRHQEAEVVFTGSKENRANRSYVTIDVPYDDVYDVNYFMFNNKSYMNRWFYAFVTKIEYVNSSRTRMYFTIDVIQTWMFEIDFQPSYVKREHQTEYQSNGKPVVNTIPEKLDYGTDYDTIYEYHFNPFEGLQWLVIQAKQEIHTVEEGDQQISPSFIGAPQPLVTYLYPVNRNGTGRFPVVEVNHFERKFDPKKTDFEFPVEDVLKEIYKNESSVNNVVNIFLTENTGLPMSVSGTGGNMTVNFTDECFIQSRVIGDKLDPIPLLQLTFAPNFHFLKKSLFDQYDVITKPTESKLLMYPYTILIMDDFKGNRVEYKLEYIDGKVEVIAKGSVGVNNKTSYTIDNYNNLSEFASIEAGFINDSPNDIAIVNDYTSAYMQGNANSLRNRLDAAAFSGITNTIGSTLSAVGSLPSVDTATQGGGANLALGTAQSANNLVQTAGQSVFNIQGIDAQLKDINNMPPNLVKMGGNIAFSFGNLYSGVRFMIKQIKPEYYSKLKGFFKSYGYKSNRIKIPNLRTRTAFNYVETEGCNIKGNIPNEDLNDLKAIFDGGITLWHVNDVGNYNVTNGVR
ncbi:tail protein [Bacillus phage GA1]|uniref:Tail protein n=1 Tax=Bacillus phage GA-1 TaxID=2679898 RepID=Q9FZW6_BPGA1|nr:tail protein [Bacillus phage GA1]CAC21530.1 tail protein [Bacillus phage GA1]